MSDRHMVRSVMVLCAGFVLSGWVAAPAQITRYPYLQPTAPSDTTVGIAWRTARPSGSRVEYGLEDPSENSVEDEGQTTEHFVVLKGLRPGQAYRYRVVSDGTTTPVYRLRTSPPDGHFRALVLSDTHAQQPGDRRHAQWLERWTKYLYPRMVAYDPHLVLICGDITQTGQAAEYDELFLRARDLFASAIVLPVQGNHDRGADTFREQFHLPDGPEGLAEIDYSYDYGGCHFLVLWRVNDAAIAWAKQDLARARQARFHFGMWHYPVYVDTWRELEDDMVAPKRLLIDLFEQYGMDVWFQGHRHTIQRTLPIVKNPDDPAGWGLIRTPQRHRYNASTRGTIYLQIRSSYYGPEPGHGLNPYMAYDDAGKPESVGFSTMDVSGAECTIRSFRCTIDGQDWGQEDEFTIDKADTTTPAAPRFVGAVSAANVTGYRAEIRARTDVAARVVIDYGTAPGRYTFHTAAQDVAQAFDTRHTIWLHALQPQTTYYFRARATVAGKTTQSAESSFTTGKAEAGQVVAKFSFQPKQYVPPDDFSPAGDVPYSPRARCGWLDDHVIANRQFLPDYGEETGTFCAVDNSGKAARWQADLPNGTYDVQVGRANAEEEAVTTGDTRISLEAGQATMEAPAEPRSQTFRTWTRRVTVSDGRLDVELGCDDKDSKDASVISWLIVRDAWGTKAEAGEPAAGVAVPASRPVPSRRGAWARPGE